MDTLGVTVLVMALLTAVGVSNGQQTGCSTAQNDCQRSAAVVFGNSSATDEDKCGKAKEVLSCVKNLTCTSDVTFRALFLVTLDRLTALNLSSCEINSMFYPTNISAFVSQTKSLIGSIRHTGRRFPQPDLKSCDAKKQACLFSYVDDLNKLNKTQNISDPKSAKCQQLSYYIQCLKNTGSCISNESILAIKAREEETTAGQHCVVPSVASSLTLEECSSGVKQCQSINWMTNDSIACLPSQEAMRCLVNLSCVSDVILRIFQVQTKHNLTNATCEIDNIFPLEQASLNDCQKGRKACVYPYVETLLSKNTWTPPSLCVELNNYMNCTVEIDACVGIIQPKTIADHEISRMNIAGCVVSSTNSGGERSAVALVTLVVAALMLSRSVN